MANAFDTYASELLANTANSANTSNQTEQSPNISLDFDPYTLGAIQQENIDQRALSELEQDIVNLPDPDIIGKYGFDLGERILSLRASGAQKYYNDKNTQRTADDIVADTISGVGSGLFNSIAGIGALAAGAVNKDWGTSIAQGISDINQKWQGIDSQGLQASRRALQARQQARDAVSEKQYQDDLANGKSSVVAGLRKISRDIFNTGLNYGADSASLGEGASQAVGSLFAGGPVSKIVRGGINAVGKLGSKEFAKRAANVAEKQGWAGAVGLMEGGGGYQQAVDTVMQIPIADLYANSLDFAKLVQKNMNQGMTKSQAEQEAKIEIANGVGLRTALAAGTAGALLGKMTDRLEGVVNNPFKYRPTGEIIGNTARETIEEAAQGGATQLAQNLAVKALANKNQDITEGVGEQIGTGALFSLASTPTIQAPGYVGGRIKQRIQDKINAFKEEKEQSYSNPNALASHALKVNQDITFNHKDQIDSAINNENISEETKIGLQTIKDNVTHQNDLSIKRNLEQAKRINEGTASIQDIVDFAKTLDANEAIVNAKINKEDLGNSPIIADVNHAKAIANKFNQFEDVQKAKAKLQEFIEHPEKISAKEANVAKEHAVNRALNDKLNKQQISNVVQHSDKFGFTDQQKKLMESLKMSYDLEEDHYKALKNISETDEVHADVDFRKESRQIGMHSMHTYASNIGRNIYNNNVPEAKKWANQLAEFVDHYNNKIAALEESRVLKGQRVGYLKKNLDPGEDKRSPTWKPWTVVEDGTENAIFFNRLSPQSIANAQAVLADANYVAGQYNQIVDAFPELNLKKKDVKEIHGLSPEGFDLQKAYQYDQSNKDKDSSLKDKSIKDQDKEKETNTDQKGTDTDKDNKHKVTQQDKVDNASQEPSGSQDRSDDDKVQKEKTDDSSGSDDDAPVEPAKVKTKTDTNESESVSDEKTAIRERIRKIQQEAVSEAPDQTDPSYRYDISLDEEESHINPENTKSPLVQKIKKTFRRLMHDLLYNNFFIRKNHLNLLVGQDNPLEYALNVLKDPSKNISDSTNPLIASIVKDNPAIASAWANYTQKIHDAVLTTLEERLNDPKGKLQDIFQRNKKDIKTGDALLNKDPATGIAGKEKIITFVDEFPDENERFHYNKPLIDQALIATAQWLVTMSRRPVRKLDDVLDDNPSINSFNLDEKQEQALTTGMSKFAMLNSLTAQLYDYMGLKDNPRSGEAENKAVIQSLALEIISALEYAYPSRDKTNKPIIVRTKISNEDSDIASVWFNIDLDSFISKKNNLRQCTGLLDELFSRNSKEQRSYWLGDKVPVMKHVLHGSDQMAPLSEKQQESIANREKVEYKLNPLMLEIVNAVGEEGLITFFGSTADEENSNKYDFASKQSSNNLISHAYEALQESLITAQAIANQKNIPLEEVTRHYAYGITTTGRFQMLESYNPQGNKLHRELWMSTRANLDFTNKKDLHNYYRAIAQGFGVKVHKNNIYDIVNTLNSLKDKPAFQQAKAIIDKGPSSTEDMAQLRALFDEMGIDKTFVSFHCFVDYCHFRNVLKANKGALPTNYQTSVYLEADGVTNGIANAHVIMSVQKFDDEWIQTAKQFGLSIDPDKQSLVDIYNSNNKKRESVQAEILPLETQLKKLEKQRNKNKVDEELEKQIEKVQEELTPLQNELAEIDDDNIALDDFYTTTANNATKAMDDVALSDKVVYENYAVNHGDAKPTSKDKYHTASEARDALKFITSVIDNNDVEPNMDKWSFSRSFVKNPITTINYGAMKNALARKMYNTLMKGFGGTGGLQAKLTYALQYHKYNPKASIGEAFFSNPVFEETRKKQAKKENKEWKPLTKKEKEILWNKFTNQLNLVNQLVIDFNYDNSNYDPIYFSTKSKFNLNNWNALKNFSPRIEPYIDKQGKKHDPAIIKSIKVFFVDPILNTTKEAMASSDEALNNAAMINNIMVLNAKQIFIYELNKLASKFVINAKAEHQLRKGLTKKDIDELWDNLKHSLPQFSTEIMNFQYWKQDWVQYFNQAKEAYASSLDSFQDNTKESKPIPTEKINATIQTLGDPGIGSMPLFNIIFGDAQMMLLLSQFEKSLDVFDGFNMSVDSIKTVGLEANKAVTKTWLTSNLYTAVLQRYQKLMRQPEKVTEHFLKNYRASADQPAIQAKIIKDIEDYARAATGWFVHKEGVEIILSSKDGKVKFDNYEDLLKYSEYQLKVRYDYLYHDSLTNDARHYALFKAGFSVDQMASSENPFIVPQQQPVSLELLNEYYKDFINNVDNCKETWQQEVNDFFDKGIVPESTKKKIETKKEQARKVKDTGTQLDLFGGRVTKLVKKDFTKLYKLFTPEQKIVFNLVQWSGLLDKINIFTGSQKDLIELAQNSGDDSGSLEQANAWVSIDGTRLYVVDGTPKDILHECIHALTGVAIHQYFDPVEQKNLEPYKIKAIANIKILLDQFMSIPKPKDSMEYSAIAYIQDKIKNLESEERQVSEFLAYTLSDNEVQQALKQIPAYEEFLKTRKYDLNEVYKKAQSPVKAIFSKALAWFKKLVFGGHSFKVTNDLLSQITFNAGIISSSATEADFFKKDIADVVQYSEPIDKFHFLRNKALSIIEQKGLSKQFEQAQGKNVDNSEMIQAFPEMDQDQIQSYNLIKSFYDVAEKINPILSTRMHDIYNFIVKNIKAEDLYNPNIKDEDSKLYDATQKLQYIQKASYSDLMALGLTSDIFVNSLKNKTFKDFKEPLTGSKIDQVIDDLGNRSLESVSNILGGSFYKKKDIASLIENLFSSSINLATSSSPFYKNPLNRVENYLVEHIQRPADAVYEKTLQNYQKYEQEGANIFKRLINSFAMMVSALLGSDKTFHEYLKASSLLNTRFNKSDAFAHLIDDLIGRVEDAGSATYDFFKVAKNSVQKIRNMYNDEVPKYIKSKLPEVTKEGWQTLTRAMAKVDIGCLQHSTLKEVISYYSDPVVLKLRIEELEKQITDNVSDKVAQFYFDKADELAKYMNTGKITSKNLLRNPRAIAYKLNNKELKDEDIKDPNKYVPILDELITLYAIEDLNKEDRQYVAKLAKDNTEGFALLFGNLCTLNKEEFYNLSEQAFFNYYKGYIPFIKEPGKSLILVPFYDKKAYENKGYTFIKETHGKAYMLAPINTQAMYNEGAVQIVRNTVMGVSTEFGRSINLIKGKELGSLIPVFDEEGKLKSFDDIPDVDALRALNPEQDLAILIGKWTGRHIEESNAETLNRKLAELLNEDYNKYKDDPSQKDVFVDVYELAKTDPVVADALSLVPYSFIEKLDMGTRIIWLKPKDEIDFNDLKEDDYREEPKFMVRKNQLDNILGWRSASVGDFWTGNNTLNPKVNKLIVDFFTTVFGKKAYVRALQIEKLIESSVASARRLIVVKSMVVPIANAFSNICVLAMAGVPIGTIVKGALLYTTQIETYIKSQLHIIKLSTKYRALGNSPHEQKLIEQQIKHEQDYQKTLKIYPLLEAGEFASVADVGVTPDDLKLTGNNWADWITNQIERVPDSAVKTIGKNILISKDTSLYKALNKTVQYGDFVAKCILYDYLTSKDQHNSKQKVLGLVKEFFVDYDKAPGRTRQKLENMGLMWFWSYKLRIAKIALWMLRNRPLQAILGQAAMNFGPDALNVGTPLTDNLFAKGSDLLNSLGIGTGLRAPSLVPAYNLIFG